MVPAKSYSGSTALSLILTFNVVILALFYVKVSMTYIWNFG